MLDECVIWRNWLLCLREQRVLWIMVSGHHHHHSLWIVFVETREVSTNTIQSEWKIHISINNEIAIEKTP